VQGCSSSDGGMWVLVRIGRGLACCGGTRGGGRWEIADGDGASIGLNIRQATSELWVFP